MFCSTVFRTLDVVYYYHQYHNYILFFFFFPARVKSLLAQTVIQTTRKLLNYQAPFQLEREPTSVLAMVP